MPKKASIYAVLPCERFLRASAIETLPKKAPIPARPTRRRKAGPRTAHSRGGKRSCSEDASETKGCGQLLYLALTYEKQSPDRVVCEDKGGDEQHRAAKGFVGGRLVVRSISSGASEAWRVQAWSRREEHNEGAMGKGA